MTEQLISSKQAFKTLGNKINHILDGIGYNTLLLQKANMALEHTSLIYKYSYSTQSMQRSITT